MKKTMKHVTIDGVLKSRGEYFENAAFRTYEPVSLVDKDGDEVHFYSLAISKRLDDRIAYNTPMRFYVFRDRRKGKLFGYIYAVEIGDEKIFYPDIEIPGLKGFAYQGLERSQFINNPPVGFMAVLMAGVPLSLLLKYFIGSGFLETAIIIIPVLTFYMFKPAFSKAKFAGIKEMKQTLSSAGFNIDSKSAAKY